MKKRKQYKNSKLDQVVFYMNQNLTPSVIGKFTKPAMTRDNVYKYIKRYKLKYPVIKPYKKISTKVSK